MITKLLVLILVCSMLAVLGVTARFQGGHMVLWGVVSFLAGSGAVYWAGVIEGWRRRSSGGSRR